MVADALSRLNKIESEELGIVQKVVKREDLFKGLEQAYQNDKETKRLLEKQDAEKDFCVVQNKLFYTGKGRMQLYLPQGAYRDFIMNECHDTRYAGHLGMKKTEELVQRDFYWPTLHQDVTSYVQTCEECQRNKASNLQSAGLLQPLEVPSQRWERISMDFYYTSP